MFMRLKYPINLHKGMTFAVVLLLMYYYDNFSISAWIYLSLHGSYGILWILKGEIFPDKQWEELVSIPFALLAFFSLGLYWIAPFLLISRHLTPDNYVIAAAVGLNIFGVMLHFGSDTQKYFTLKYKTGLITEGFFRRCRNTNYLGELMIYLGFALLSGSWMGFIGIGAFFFAVFIPNMIRKDKSLSRYPDFQTYKREAGWLLPNLFRS